MRSPLLCCWNVSVNGMPSASVTWTKGFLSNFSVTYVAEEISLNTSSVYVAGTSPLIASAVYHIACFVSLFEVILISHNVFTGSIWTPLLGKNNNMVVMLMCDALLRHFRKRMFHRGIVGCTLLSLMYSWYYSCSLCDMVHVTSYLRFSTKLCGQPSQNSVYVTNSEIHWWAICNC